MGSTLAAIIELPTDYVDGTLFEVEFTVTSLDESETFARAGGGIISKRRPDADPKVATTPVLIDMSRVALTKTGRYKVNGTIAGQHARSLIFEVVATEPQALVPRGMTAAQASDQPTSRNV
jgi:hypothetical protein